MEKECFTCAWHDNFSWVCFNGNSEHRADFTDPEDSCPVWEGREDSDEKEEKTLIATNLSIYEISNYINEMNIMSYRFKKINNQYYLNNIK